MRKKPTSNPFKPTAGAEPPVLAGREKVVEDFTDGLLEGPGAPGRLMRITGPRGSGKTVLLTELGDVARGKGWTVVDETAGKGIVERICSRLVRDSPDADLSADLDFGFVKAHAGMAKRETDNDLRSILSAAISRPGRNGVLVTVDEVQDADKEDMAAIAMAVQHLIREKKDVAFIFAGLTTGVADFINVTAVTFLRRAKAEQLEAIPDDEVSVALRKPFEDTGFSIADKELAEAVSATSGYAYLVQLVGYNVWKVARRHRDDSISIDSEDVRKGVSLALEDYAEAVLEPALARLSERAIRYLIAMAGSDGPSSASSLAKALGVPSTSLSSARRTLISRQIIEATEVRGFVRFSIPGMREYVNGHADELLGRFD